MGCWPVIRIMLIRTRLKKLNVICIDTSLWLEVVCSTFLNFRLQQIMRTNEPFGGISVINCLRSFPVDQLKIVNIVAVLSQLAFRRNTSPSSSWRKRERDEKKNHKHFEELLNRLREGNFGFGDEIAILKQRLLNVTPESDNYPTNTAHLFTTNASVDTHNNALYSLSRTDKGYEHYH